MATRRIHMNADIRGLLHKSNAELHDMFVDPATKRSLSAREAREFLMDELVKGHKLLPLAPNCEGFDYTTGCPGHAVPDSEGT